jgi:hypothetical protein
MKKTNDDGQTFGSWLLAQRDRNVGIGPLIAGAKSDRRFPRYGTPDAVREYLNSVRANASLVRMVDEAEREWLR